MTERKWEISLSVARCALVATGLVVAYYLAPLDRPLDTGSAIWFLLALLALGMVIPWQVYAILNSGSPWLRVAHTVGIGLPLFLVLFAATYVVIDTSLPDAFTEPLSRTDSLYFTVTVFATVGFGDIAPQAEIARIIAMTQMLTGLLAVGLVAKVLFGAARTAVRRRGRVPATAVGFRRSPYAWARSRPRRAAGARTRFAGRGSPETSETPEDNSGQPPDHG